MKLNHSSSFHKDDFEYIVNRNCPTDTFRHRQTGIDFQYLPGGHFKMGLSDKEATAALKISAEAEPYLQRMKPVREVFVQPFLIARTPVTHSFAQGKIKLNPAVFRPDFGDDIKSAPIYLTRAETHELCEVTGFSIISESQWEYSCRGGTQTLFYFGDVLPDERTLSTTICSYTSLMDSTAGKFQNPFGLLGLSVGEWCADNFFLNHVNAPTDDLPRLNSSISSYVCRGGAAALWPWQDSLEWLLCASAMRYSSDELEGGTCGLRFVMRLPEGFC